MPGSDWKGDSLFEKEGLTPVKEEQWGQSPIL